MRVGLLTQWFEPEPGPAGLPGTLARGLLARGHEVSVVTGFPNYPTGRLAPGYRVRPRTVEDRAGVQVTRVALYPSHADSIARRVANYGSFAAAAATLGVARTFRDIDVLWVNYSPVTVALPMAVQRALRSTPSVVHVLDLWPDTLTATGFLPGRGAARMAVSVADRAAKSMYAAADRVAYISPGVGEVLSSRGVPRSKLSYAPMWADESIYGHEQRGAERGFGLDADDVAVLYAGTLGRAQGLETLIEASATLREAGLVCLIAGSGTEEQRLKRKAIDLGADNVRFLGRLPSAEMPRLMAAVDVHFVALNDDPLARITMPSKVQTILAFGGAMVGSVVGDAAAVIEESGAGWTCAPGDARALTRLLHQVIDEGSSGSRTRGIRGRRYYDAHFAMDVGIDRIEKLLLAAVESGEKCR